jgi:hypothetical protein
MATDSNFPNNDPLVDDDIDVNSLLEGAEAGEVEEDRTEVAATSNVVSMLPVHAAPLVGGVSKGGHVLKMERQRGRPRKVERMPTTSDLEYHCKMTEEKARFIDLDSLVQATAKRADPLSMLAIVKCEVAKESAALHFQRIENEKYGKDTAQISTRRIDALKKIADIELELKKLGGSTVDVRGESMQRIFKFFIDTVRAILQENLAAEQIDLVFNRLGTEFEGWQEKLDELLR